MRYLSLVLLFTGQALLSSLPSFAAGSDHVQTVSGSDGLNEQRWTIRCSQDDFSDEKSCTITPQNRDSTVLYYNLFFIVLEGGSVFADINLSDDTYPGSTKYIRVDNNKTVTVSSEEMFFLESGSSSPAEHANLFSQLKDGKEVKIRWYKWPYENRRYDEAFPLAGLGDAISVAHDYISGTLKYSKKDAIGQIEMHASLMGTYYSQLKACGKKSEADSLVSQTLEMLLGNPEFITRFVDAFDAIVEIDPYGVILGGVDCGDAGNEMNQSITKIKEVVANLKE